jgi:hypothetical protein
MSEEMIYPPVTIVIKDIATLPESAEIVHATAELLRDSRPAPKEYRGAHFNLFLDEPPPGRDSLGIVSFFVSVQKRKISASRGESETHPSSFCRSALLGIPEYFGWECRGSRMRH